MRHLKRGRQLNRNPSHLLALKRNLATRLFAHDRIVTTVAKAKELRPFAEKLITIAKKGAAQLDLGKDGDKTARANALHYRRQLYSKLGGRKFVEIGENRIDVVEKLLNDIGPRFAARPGGYIRIVKQVKRRLGDGAPTAIIELLSATESSAAPAAPAPAVKS